LVKGAIDRILDICIGYLENGNIKMQMTKGKYDQIIQTASGLGQSGLRGFFFEKTFFSIKISSNWNG